MGVFLIPTALGASCGDGICNNGENCTSCSADCGSYNCSSPIDCPYMQRSNGTYIEYTQFINGGDGILVLDRDGDGVVDAEDLFGGRTLTGRDVDNAFEDFALFDSDGSGVINSSDNNYTQLKIWLRNSTSLNLVAINSTNISSINLAYRDRTASDPPFWQVAGTFNLSGASNLPLAIGVNFTTNFNGNLVQGDFLVLDLDNATNISVTSCTQCSTPITINIESPANATTESSDSTPSFTFNITDNSATVNCTLWINSSGALASFAYNSSVLNATSTTLTANTSLSNGDYHWWINCSDNSGARVSAYESVKRLLTINIVASSSSSSSSSSSGGGGGSISTQSFWINTFAEDNLNLSEKGVISKNLSVRDRIRVKINGEQHFIGVINLTNNSITINISSTPQQAILTIGDEKTFDVNGSGYNDLFVKLNSINDSKANLELKYIYEKMSEEIVAGEAQNESESDRKIDSTGEVKNINENKTKLLIIISLVLIFIIIFFTYQKLKEKRKNRH